MPKVDMNCPRCGKESTEYSEGKWKCLQCGARFIYDPMAPEKEPKEHSNLVEAIFFGGMIVVLFGLIVALPITAMWLQHTEKMASLKAAKPLIEMVEKSK